MIATSLYGWGIFDTKTGTDIPVAFFVIKTDAEQWIRCIEKKFPPLVGLYAAYECGINVLDDEDHDTP